MNKCQNGYTFKPDGKHELGPCSYKVIEKYENCTVEVLQCKKCGHIEVLWHKQDNTKEVE